MFWIMCCIHLGIKTHIIHHKYYKIHKKMKNNKYKHISIYNIINDIFQVPNM